MAFSTRALGVLLALTVAAQTLAHGGAVLVCRVTGAVVDPCACPHAHDAGDDASVERRGCCEVRQHAAPAVPGVVKAAVTAPSRQVVVALLPAAPRAFATGRAQLGVEARQQAPPSTPLYLSHRSLLL